uniref:Uncharacterized protein n=1 Tax=Xiphophorus couchianus TaxID=32473 RepID=A0A3B5LEH8_9TELE
MTDYQGDVEGASTPMELYEKLSEQGGKVRSLKSAEADKVSFLLCACIQAAPEFTITMIQICLLNILF